MRYIGKLSNGKVFDKNTGGKPVRISAMLQDSLLTLVQFTFALGKGQVIKGWDDGLVGLQPGGTHRLSLPPQILSTHI
jgi:FK506-binding nuclear protein